MTLFIIGVLSIGFLAMGMAVLYNRLAILRNNLGREWANLEAVLKQRHDQIAKLIEACKGYMKYEKDTLEQMLVLRTGFAEALSLEEKLRIEGDINRSCGVLHLVWEKYPDLKAVEGVKMVMGQMIVVESKIADHREAFNDAVNRYNEHIESFPDIVLAKLLRCQRQKYLDAICPMARGA